MSCLKAASILTRYVVFDLPGFQPFFFKLYTLCAQGGQLDSGRGSRILAVLDNNSDVSVEERLKTPLPL
jgi:hypothetical protein